MREMLEMASDRAIVVVDMIHQFLDRDVPNSVEPAPDMIGLLQGEIQYFRERNRPVIYAKTIDPNRDTKNLQFEIIPQLAPRPGDQIIEKSGLSAFGGTGLRSLLDKLGVTQITICGLETHTGILSTALEAKFHGFRVVVPEPCVCARTKELHEFAMHIISKSFEKPA